MKKSTIFKSLGLKSNTSTTSLLKKTMQVTAFTFSCLVALPSFVQTADAQSCGDNGVYCDDGEVIAWGYGSHWSDDLDWDWVIYPTGDYPDGCDEYSCDNGSSGGGNGDPLICFNLVDRQPDNCDTDPGNANQLNYQNFVSSNLNSILTHNGSLITPTGSGNCSSGGNCPYPGPTYPFMTEALATMAVNLFAVAYYDTFDYQYARNWIVNMLSITCNNTFNQNPNTFAAQIEYAFCVQSQADFIYSMTPDDNTIAATWTGSLQFQAPWGTGLTFRMTNNYNTRSWTTNLLTKVRNDRLCHLWYKALDDNNCPNTP